VAGLRKIGPAISPAYGYYDVPPLNLAAAVPASAGAPLPLPAGAYDATLTYATSQPYCANQNVTLPTAFLIQVPPTTQTSSPAAPVASLLLLLLQTPKEG
jgi:hypothetical protein